MKHLTDEQLVEWLAGESGEQTRLHLQSCERCQAEAILIKDGIRRYTIALRQKAASAQSAQMPGDFVPSKVLAQHRLRWAGAGVLVLLLAAQTAWILKSRPATSLPSAGAVVNSQPNLQPNLQPNPQPNPLSEPEPSAQMSDDELLDAVNNDLSRDVPRALAPVSEITVARNKIAAAFAREGSSGENSIK